MSGMCLTSFESMHNTCAEDFTDLNLVDAHCIFVNNAVLNSVG